MSEAATALLDQLLKLSEADRSMIAERLWASLSDATRAELIDETTSDPEFQAELERRLKEAHDHPERLLDGASACGGRANNELSVRAGCAARPVRSG